MLLVIFFCICYATLGRIDRTRTKGLKNLERNDNNTRNWFELLFGDPFLLIGHQLNLQLKTSYI